MYIEKFWGNYIGGSDDSLNLLEYLADKDKAEISLAEIFADLGLDSLDIVDLLVELHKTFGIALRNNEEVRKVRTLGDVYDCVCGRGGDEIEMDAKLISEARRCIDAMLVYGG